MKWKMRKTLNKDMNRTIIGIDYSLTSPAICVTTDFKIENSNFYFLSSKKKHEGKFGKYITGQLHDEWDNPIERFAKISDWVIFVLEDLHPDPNRIVFIEGYSFGSKGQGIFQIAENCGILKYRLQEEKIPYDIVVPSVVKKHATGKGNADKDMMYEAWLKDTKIDLKQIFDTSKVGNPLSDIVDSYYIARTGYENIESKKTSKN